MVICNLCDWTGEQFETRFRDHGRRCRCPQCGSLDIDRHLHYVVSDAVQESGATAALAISPSGALLGAMRRDLLCAAVSPSPESGDVIQMNPAGLEFPDGYFHLVACSRYFERLPDDAAAMREVLRVLAPGGRLISQAPYRTGVDTEEHPEPDKHGHLRHYGHHDIQVRLSAAGFETEPVNYAEMFAYYGFEPLDVFVSTKPRGEKPERSYYHGLLRFLSARAPEASAPVATAG